MTRQIALLESVVVNQDYDGRVHFTADMDIDADGANGQNGKRAAYMVNNTGSEDLANGGMGMKNGKVIGISDWFDDIVILENGQPREFPGGIIASKTAYRFKGIGHDTPEAYVDSETVPYIVVSPRIRNRASGIVLGCKARLTNLTNGAKVDAVVADIGPVAKIGEASIAAARAIGVNPNPRTGGEERRSILYELWPGVPAVVGGVTFDLVPA